MYVVKEVHSRTEMKQKYLAGIVGGIVFTAIWLALNYYTKQDAFFQPIVGGVCFSAIWLILAKLGERRTKKA